MLIVNGKIFTMETPPSENGYVRIKGKYIEEVGDMHNFQPRKEREEIVFSLEQLNT